MMVKGLIGVRESLGGGPASVRTAKIAMEMMAERRRTEYGQDNHGRG
jgi:hypothetical protein